MKRLWMRILISVFTFFVGVSAVYLTWLAYREPLEIPPVESNIAIPDPIKVAEARIRNNSAKDEWEVLTTLEGCTFGARYYGPRFDAIDPEEIMSPEAGVFYSKRWLAFLRRDRNETVPFLISQIPEKSETNIHIDPFGNALRGELAVYSLQFILKINWYKLKTDYETRLDQIKDGETFDQEVLQKIIGTRTGAREMMDLWQNVYEQSSRTVKSSA